MLGGMQAEINRGQYFAELGVYATPGSAMDHQFIKISIIDMRKKLVIKGKLPLITFVDIIKLQCILRKCLS